VVHALFFVAEVKFLFYSVVLYYRFNEFGVDGGPAAKALRPKFDAFTHRVHSQVGFQLPQIDVSFPSFSIMCIFSGKLCLFIMSSFQSNWRLIKYYNKYLFNTIS